MKMKIIPSLGMLALSAFPTFAQDAQPAAATPVPAPPPAQTIPAPVTQPSPVTQTIPAPAAPEQTPASNNVSQVLKLAKAGLGDEVIIAYVKNSRAFYNLAAEDVLKLKDAGLSSPVISAMLAHDNALRAQKHADLASSPVSPSVPAPVAAPPPAPAPVPVPTTPAPSPTATPAPAPTASVAVQSAAPPPQVEYVPVSPGPDYYWSDGYWSWNGGAWVWVGGSWNVRPGVRVFIGGGPRYGHWRRW
jgi:hypothetical protein